MGRPSKTELTHELLEVIVAGGPITLVTSLLDRGADPNARDEEGVSALELALDLPSVVRQLLKRKNRPDPNLAPSTGDGSLLHRLLDLFAVEPDTLQRTMKLLLHYGIDWEKKDSQGQTALEKADAQHHPLYGPLAAAIARLAAKKLKKRLTDTSEKQMKRPTPAPATRRRQQEL